MFSVADFLDRAKAGAGNVTDYRLAKLVGVTTQAVSAWRVGRTTPDERSILKLCALSGDDPEHVAACIQSMRAANDDAADLWRRVAARLQGGVADLAILSTLVALAFAAHTLPAGELADAVARSVHYVNWIALARLAWRIARRSAPAPLLRTA